MRLSFLACAGFLLLMITACGGGGGGNAVTPIPATETPSTPISFVDSLPSDNTSGVAVDARGFSLVHSSRSGASFNYQMACDGLSTLTVRRSVLELSDVEIDQLVDHKFICPDGLVAGTGYSLGITEGREDGEQLAGTRSFTTGTDESALNVLLEKRSSRQAVDELFTSYISGALLGEFQLSQAVELLVLGFITDLAASEWDNLSHPQGLYDVIAQRVQYGSIQPDGSFSSELTGLVAFPDVADVGTFEKRNRVILLTHATGSTPSELSDGDAWYILANLIASQGYLVIAPDNYGRGGTSGIPETYLQANRTGINVTALLDLVSNDPFYDFAFGSTLPVDLDIIGYSQGGHSAIASWLELERSYSGRFQTRRVHSGGAPLALYKTVRGVLQQIDGSCQGDSYCNLVDNETSLPFVTDLILPALLAYTDTGLTEEEVIVGDELNQLFVSGFLAGDEAYDNIKMLMQLSSFTNVLNPEVVFVDDLVSVSLYHSQYDRLVPVSNTIEFASVLDGTVAVILDEDMCNSVGFGLIFEAVEKVGVLHTLCGLDVLDGVFDQLR